MECVVCMMGVPGSGKTTLSGRLQRRYGWEVASLDEEVILNEGQGWKEARHAALERAMTRTGGTVLVVDDTMHYRSMRRLVFTMAAARNTPYCQVYLNVDVCEAERRNNGRCGTARVERRVLRQVAERTEVPDPVRHQWEQYSLVLCGDDIGEKEEEEVERLVSAAKMGFRPVEERGACAPPPEQSTLHLADLALRRLVSRHQTPALIAPERRHLLEKIRRGHLPLPPLPQNKTTAIDLLSDTLLPHFYAHLAK